MAGKLLRFDALPMLQPTTAGSSRSVLLIIVGLILAIVAVYSGVAQCDFIFLDDPSHVIQNPTVRGGLTGPGLVQAFTEPHAALWVPLTMASFMADISIFGLSPGAMHIENIAWHAGAAVLLFLALRRLTGRLWPSAIVAALFALHPLNVESVAWVTERKNVLCGFFFMLALYSWSGWAREGRATAWWGTLAAFTAALLAKPVAVTFPCVLLLLDAWPLRRFSPARWWRLLVEKVPFFLLSGFVSYMAIWAGKSLQGVVSHEVLPMEIRVTNALCSYGAYLADLVWPHGLAVFYPHPEQVQWGRAIAVLAGLLAALGISAWQWRRRPYLLIGLLLFLGMLVPNLGLVQVGAQARADRFVYFAEIGFFVAVVWWLDSLLPASAKLRAVAAAMPLGALGVATTVQVTRWEDSLSLFKHTMEVTTPNVLTLRIMAEAMNDAGQPKMALQEAEKFLDAFKNSPSYWYLLGTLHMRLSDYRLAARDFSNALALDPSDTVVRSSFATALAALGETKQAEAEFQRAAAAGPLTYSAHFNYGLLLEKLGRKDEARREFSAALQLVPNSPPIVNALRRLDNPAKM